jgi:molybdopterin/thiamine biosynthesis adenylyltransferase
MSRYERLFERNFPLIDLETQQKMRHLKVAVIGVGALSFVAEYLTRLGVQKFILIDGDEIGPENINHQRYSFTDIGKNKAKALAEYLLQINPELEVTALPTHLLEQNFDEIWSTYLCNVDVIVDGIDPLPNISISKKLAQKCREKGITYLYPLDIGNGALLITSAEQFEMLLEGNDPLEILINMTSKIQDRGIVFPARVHKIIEKFIKKELLYYPQTVIAATTASLLVIATVVQIIQDKKPPSLIYCDFTEDLFKCKG